MDRFAAMIILLGVLVSLVLILLALFAVAPITCSCLISLLYSLYLFMAYEESGVHHAQEFENRFWTIFALLLSTALFFANDSPLAFGLWSPSLGFIGVLISGYAMHLWDRYTHRVSISQQTNLRRSSTASASLVRLRDLGIPVEEQLKKINECLRDIDQLLIPSTINNFINQRFTLAKEREIITIFEECDARALNHLISHVKLGLLFYKIKDHRNFNGKHRTELINLLAVERLSILTVISRVIVLHSLQLLKLRANPRAEYWVRNIILNTHQDELSELKTLTDAKGDYFCMNKLIFDDIKSESVRQDILNHIRKEAAVQQTHLQMGTRRSKQRVMQWRKVLSDVDDTLYCSGGMYPAGVDRRFAKKAVYPGVLAFYRELDIGTKGPEQWEDEHVGNLVFLSARPHVYKDMSEKANFAKFEKLRARGEDGRQGLHTMPSLLAGDLASGSHYIVTNDFEPLARKKFDNFRRYVSIYPEYQHVFVCDNGQGDVRAGELMFDSFPYEFEALYVHVVQERTKTYGYDPERWRRKEFYPCFFKSYPEAALHAATRYPPLIRIKGLQRICRDAAQDFAMIKVWPSDRAKSDRRLELNQAIWMANKFLAFHGEEEVDLVTAERRWEDGQKVRTPYGVARILAFDPIFDLYDVELDWRSIDIQVAEHIEEAQNAKIQPRNPTSAKRPIVKPLATVVEADEQDNDSGDESQRPTTSTEATTTETRLQDVKLQAKGESSAENPTRYEIELPPDDYSQLETEIRVETPTQGSSPDTGRFENTVRSIGVIGSRAGLRARARIGGRFITKYTPPTLPKIEVQKGSLFTFLSPTEGSKEATFKEGDEYSTPYGPARVVEYRRKEGIVVVDIIGWKARAYLQKSSLKVMSKSLLKSLLRQFSSGESSKTAPKPTSFPYVEGTVIVTPFGKGTVSKPIPPPTKVRQERVLAPNRPSTIGLSLDSWTLANGKHPVLYCTVETARMWKDRKTGDSPSLFSALGTLVTSSRTLLEPFLAQKPNVPTKAPEKRHERYYEDAAAVTTPFGDGRVVSFREADGFYEVSLSDWKLANGKTSRAYLRKADIRHRIAKGCQEGYPVLTSFGLSGKLASVEPTTGVHIVTVPSAGMICYLQPECIVCPLKAAIGEDTLTPFGDGRIERYDVERDMYTIALTWGARLYCKGDTFDRVGDGIQDRDGPFGVNWLLRFLFFSSQSSSTTATRSRSNSLVSGHSSRSVS